MNQNLKKWLLSGLIFLLAGAIIVVITAVLAFADSILYRFILFPAICIFAGYLALKLVHKIDEVQAPMVTSASALIFSVYSTIITVAVILITKLIDLANHQMDYVAGPQSSGVGIDSASFFAPVNPLSSAMIVFIGLNLAHWIYWLRGPEKNWKDIVPHVCAIIVLVALYLVI
jgi:hypothetical protein